MTRIPTTGSMPRHQPEPRRQENLPVTETVLIVGDAAPIIAKAPRDALAEASAGAIGGLLRSLRDR